MYANCFTKWAYMWIETRLLFKYNWVIRYFTNALNKKESTEYIDLTIFISSDEQIDKFR